MSDPPAAHRAPGDGPTLLIADDNPKLLRALGEMLRREGFDVVASAMSGLGAVALAKHLAPDLVLMDVRMPGLDGIHASHLIMDVCPSTEVVIYSAYDDPGLRQEADEAGVAEYLVKGCTPSEIVKALRRAWERTARSKAL
jgi:DNA-binding NarL/FixJ family response regulator